MESEKHDPKTISAWKKLNQKSMSHVDKQKQHQIDTAIGKQWYCSKHAKTADQIKDSIIIT